MKEMKEETILSILDAITPDTSWYGESNRDRQTLNNLTTLEDMIYQLYWQLMDNIDVGLVNKGNTSAVSITKMKYFIVKMFYQVFRDAKRDIEKKMNSYDEATVSEALLVAVNCMSDRILELNKEDDAILELSKEDDRNDKDNAQRHQTIINEMDALFRARDTLRDMMDMDIENEKNE